MSRSKQKGTAFERLVADGLRDALGDDRIDRLVLHGSQDKGDVTPLRNPFGLVVVECKNVRQMALAQWVGEAETERGNADADAAVVIHKRVGKGAFDEQYVTMRVKDFLQIGWGK